MTDFEPKTVVFCCNWCSPAGTDLASSLKLMSNSYSRIIKKARRIITLIKNLLPQLGIEPERLRLVLISTSEAAKFQSAADEFIDEATKLGPLRLIDKVKVK